MYFKMPRAPIAPLVERPSGSFWKMRPAMPKRKNSMSPHDGLAAFGLDLLDDLVVGRGMELHQDLADHAHARLGALACKRQGVGLLELA